MSVSNCALKRDVLSLSLSLSLFPLLPLSPQGRGAKDEMVELGDNDIFGDGGYM